MATALNNTATINGQYNGVAISPQSANVAAQILAMEVTKTASPQVWINGELTYTINVINRDDALPLANLVLTDTINTTLTSFVADSVIINGTAAPAASVTYAAATGLLTVQLPDTAVGATTAVTFRVAQV